MSLSQGTQKRFAWLLHPRPSQEAAAGTDGPAHQSPQEREAERTNGRLGRRPKEVAAPKLSSEAPGWKGPGLGGRRIQAAPEKGGRRVAECTGRRAGATEHESATRLLKLSRARSRPGLSAAAASPAPEMRLGTDRAVPVALAGSWGCRPVHVAQRASPGPHLEPRAVGRCSRIAPGRTPCFPWAARAAEAARAGKGSCSRRWGRDYPTEDSKRG